MQTEIFRYVLDDIILFTITSILPVNTQIILKTNIE